MIYIVIILQLWLILWCWWGFTVLHNMVQGLYKEDK